MGMIKQLENKIEGMIEEYRVGFNNGFFSVDEVISDLLELQRMLKEGE